MRRSTLVGLLALAACTETYDSHGLRQFSETNSAESDLIDDSETESDDASAELVESEAAAPDASISPPAETFVSDLGYEVIANGHGPVEKDRSNGEMAAGDGNMITLGGVTYPKGLGVHAASVIDVRLDGQYRTFLADVGVDDEVMDNGTIVFRVLVDGTEIFTSGTMTGAMPTKQVSVDVTGKTVLKLIVEDGGDGLAYDHGDWAGARLRK